MVLPPIDSLSITLLSDNYTDRLLPTHHPAKRAPLIKEDKFLPPPPPIAEHGFSASIIARSHYDSSQIENVHSKSIETNVLFDCGTSENGVLHNADILGIDLTTIDAIILSHGHFDHFTGIVNILKRIGKPIKVICHPDAFLKRWIVFPDDTQKAKLPFLDLQTLTACGAKVITKKDPSQISGSNVDDYKVNISSNRLDDSPGLLITGQIPRVTNYEKGFPLQYKEDNNSGKLIHDPLVNDDQAIIANIRNKGLVIISGCAHAGIINTVRYAKLLSGVDKVFAIIGGFHLTGGVDYEEAIQPTISQIKKYDPKYLIPCHCTGWKATNRMIQELPESYLQPAVCTTFTFQSTD